MKSRTLKIVTVGVVALAALDLAFIIPTLRAAGTISHTAFHRTYVQDMFGFPWWVLPAGLLFTAGSLYLLSRKSTSA